jgi:hypothetical protein
MKKNFVKSYFLWAANRPFKAAFVVALVFLLPALGAAKIVVINNDTFNAIEWDIFACFFAIMIAASFVNLIVPIKFMTHFFPDERIIILLRSENSSSRIYNKAIWGKVPYVKIYFPETWNLKNNSVQREIKLELAIRLDEQNIANLTFLFLLSFNGNFQANDLEGLIKEQKEIDRRKNVCHFQNCLQDLLINRCTKNVGKIIPHLLQCKEQKMATWELTKKLEPLSLFPNNFFMNIEVIEMRLLPPVFLSNNQKNEQ